MKSTCEIEACEKAASHGRHCSMHAARIKRHGSAHTVKVIHGDRLAGFMQKVHKTETCWEWTASTNTHGYGQFSMPTMDGARRPTTAHRAAWILLVGDIPDDKFIDHICHNRICVNPAHLRLATPKQNNENHSGRARIDSSTGIRGVYKAGDNWAVKVQHNYRSFDGGTFTTAEAAEQAAVNLRNRLFTFNDIDRVGVATVDPEAHRSRPGMRKSGSPPMCGTTTAYRKGCRCDKCKEATSDYQRKVRMKRQTNQKAA